jgi:hypothetical protein
LRSWRGSCLPEAHAARVDWRELLRRAWSETIPADYSWTRPNRRHVWNGLYLPGVICEGVGEICIAVDCSGSINARQLGLFEAEVRSILAGQQPRLVHVLYFDTEVQKSETYHAGLPIKLTPAGGGGTDFRPCFHWLEERGITPQSLVFLTDLWGSFPEQAAPYPVLWASTDRRSALRTDHSNGSRVTGDGEAGRTHLSRHQSISNDEGENHAEEGLHGGYERACADTSANGFSDEQRVSRSFDALLRPHDRTSPFSFRRRGLSVLGQIESRTLRVGFGLLIQQLTLSISIVYYLRQCHLSLPIFVLA